jgi:methylenetetrahydrofolate--tRNA-(uracil-5-)-methyltransferase
MPRLRFAGQITGVEGYVESAAIGNHGRDAWQRRSGCGESPSPSRPRPRPMGALINHITGGHLLRPTAYSGGKSDRSSR